MGACKFELLSKNSLEELETFFKENDYYGERTLDFMRLLLKELLETGVNLSEIDSFYIDYSW